MKPIKTEQGWIAIDEKAQILKPETVYNSHLNIIKNRITFVDQTVNDSIIIASTFPIEGVKMFRMPEKENLELLYQKWFNEVEDNPLVATNHAQRAFKAGYKAAQSKQFTEEDMENGMDSIHFAYSGDDDSEYFKWRNDYINSLTPEPTYTYIDFETEEEELTSLMNWRGVKSELKFIQYKSDKEGLLIIKTLK